MDVTDTDATACPTDLLAVAANDDLSPGDFGLQSFARYECVICGSVEVELQASQIDEERCSSKLMGLICLLQPSAVLGKLVSVSTFKFKHTFGKSRFLSTAMTFFDKKYKKKTKNRILANRTQKAFFVN